MYIKQTEDNSNIFIAETSMAGFMELPESIAVEVEKVRSTHRLKLINEQAETFENMFECTPIEIPVSEPTEVEQLQVENLELKVALAELSESKDVLIQELINKEILSADFN